MTIAESTVERFRLHACLPFVQLCAPEGILMGPVFFWPADQAERYVDQTMLPLVNDYLAAVSQVKVWCDEHTCHDTTKIPTSSMTCVSIDSQVNPDLRDSLLIDSLYLLYFCGAFSHLFAAADAPSLNVFTKILPASYDFIQNRDNWQEAHLLEAQREGTVILEKFDLEMCAGLGHALACGYGTDSCRSSTDTAKIQSLVRAIRYFVDRFFERFEHLIGNGLHVPPVFYEAEDIVFLTTSFEALFDLSEEHPNIDLKHKLRPMLSLRYSNAVELLWQWVDGFFSLRDQIIHGLPLPDPIFAANPNFAISYFYLGMKIFLYGVYWRLHSYQLIPPIEMIPGRPLHFKWVAPEEILVFFWPEEALLNRIHRIMTELKQNNQQPELQHDLSFLSSLMLHILDYHYKGSDTFQQIVQWTPTPLVRIEQPIQAIISSATALPAVASLLPDRFLQALSDRKSY